MRHLVLIIALFLTASFAQDETSSKWSMYAGVTSMGVQDDFVWNDRLMGNSFGVAYAVSKRMTLGIGYSGRGALVKFNKYGSQHTFKELNMPLDIIEGRGAKVQAHAIELWSAVTLLDKWGFSLWTGPVYSHFYSYDVEDGDVTYNSNASENDYGLMFGTSFPLRNKLNLNVGYYHGIKRHDDPKPPPNPKFNNLFLELGYQL